MLKSILVFFSENNFLFYIDDGSDKPILAHKSFLDGIKSLVDTHFSYIEYDFFVKNVKFYFLNLSLFDVDLQLNIAYHNIQVEKCDLLHLFKKFIDNQNYISIDNNIESYFYKVFDEQPLSFYLFEDLKLKKIGFYLISKIRENQPNFNEYKFATEIHLHAENILKLCEFNYIIEYSFSLNNYDIEINCHVSNFDINHTHNFQNLIDNINEIRRLNNSEVTLILSPYLNTIEVIGNIIGGVVFLVNDLLQFKFISFLFNVFNTFHSEKFKYILFDLNKIICYNTKLDKKIFYFEENLNFNLLVLITKNYNNILNLNRYLFFPEVKVYFTNLLDVEYQTNIEDYIKLFNILEKIDVNRNKINARSYIDKKFGLLIEKHKMLNFIEIHNSTIIFYGWNKITNSEDIAEFKTNTRIINLEELKIYLLKFCRKCKVLIFDSLFIIGDKDFAYFKMNSADILKNHDFLLVPLPENYWEELLV
jgi:hypothetical protein